MNQTLTCIALPVPACVRRGVFPMHGETCPLPASLARHILDAGQILFPPTMPVFGTDPATPEPALHAPDMGAWAGQSLKDLPPADLARWIADAGFAPPGGESRAAHLHRVARWLETLPPTPARIMVVADTTVVRAIVVAALGGTASMLSRLDIAPLTRTCLTRHAAWRVAVCGAPLP
ncbi:histidine phosphatase family protein [Komagataeibacter sp. FXV3]|uniref:histidine phosphatase family protein n=1 Tax=Komagataeibacter sp. FXV3 TaxID=2608998 RepID=UPI00187B6C2F|nr:histidine phosphatase family protein [Komagataeibacter sp. FXV3]MBE7730507.1 histidine phosphatase family protein [Komagataeibacter sp. FXV3]